MVNYISKVSFTDGLGFSKYIFQLFSAGLGGRSKLSSIYIQLQFNPSTREQYSYMVIPEYMMQITSFVEWTITYLKCFTGGPVFSSISTAIRFIYTFKIILPKHSAPIPTRYSRTISTCGNIERILSQMRFRPAVPVSPRRAAHRFGSMTVFTT